MSKIVFIDLLFNWPPDGGARVDLKEIMTRLSSRHEVTLLVPDFKDYFPRGSIHGEFPFRIVKIPFTRATFNAWHLPRAFKRAVEKLSPDHLFIGDGWYLKFPLAAALGKFNPILRFYAYEGLCIKHYGTQFRYGKICPKNYLNDTAACVLCSISQHRFHPLDTFSHEFLGALACSPLYKHSVLKALHSASTIVVYNSYMKETLSPHNGNIIVAPSGVDPAPFARARPTEKEANCIILMTGRTGDEAKGFHILLEAIRSLKRKKVDFEVIVPTYSEGLIKDDRITYTSWRSQEQLPELYARADICVVPSVWREPFGIAAVEAMAAGKPVVASASGGLAGIVEDGVTGFLVEPGNAEKLAERIKTLAADPALRRGMGRAGRERVEKLYRWDVIMEKIYFPLFQ